jgi:putative transposase
MEEGTAMKKPARAEGSCHPQVAIQLPLSLLSSLKAVKEGFFDLCIRVGEQALHALMEQDRSEVCGAKWSRDPVRRAVRGGSTASEITLGGRRVAVRRLRAATVDGRELTLPSFAWATDRDPLDEQTWRAIVSGVSTRKYAGALEPLPEELSERSTSSSAVSRRFIALSQRQLVQCVSRPLGELDLWVVMIDGIDYREHTILVALGIDSAGNKHVLGLREGTTENAAVARALLSDLAERGLPTDHSLLFVIDGAKALRKAIRDVFGEAGRVHRCHVHKIRNVLDHLPDEMHASVRRAMNQAYESSRVASARRQLERLAGSLESDHPGAAASLREGLEETLTLQRLGLKVKGALWKTLRSTNPIENLNGGVAQFTRNVRRWRGGSMILRWVGSAILEAEKRFRRVRGYREMPMLIQALRSSVQEKEVRREENVA